MTAGPNRRSNGALHIIGAGSKGKTMTYGLLTDPQYWRDRGEEMQRLGEQYKDPTTKQMMFGLATDYECLARRAEERLRSQEDSERRPK